VIGERRKKSVKQLYIKKAEVFVESMFLEGKSEGAGSIQVIVYTDSSIHTHIALLSNRDSLGPDIFCSPEAQVKQNDESGLLRSFLHNSIHAGSLPF
jgi:hypothetical protein